MVFIYIDKENIFAYRMASEKKKPVHRKTYWARTKSQILHLPSVMYWPEWTFIFFFLKQNPPAVWNEKKTKNPEAKKSRFCIFVVFVFTQWRTFIKSARFTTPALLESYLVKIFVSSFFCGVVVVVISWFLF